MAILDPGMIVANPAFDPAFVSPPGGDPADPRLMPYRGPGLVWLTSIHLSLQQFHWDMEADGHALVFLIVKPDATHFREHWESHAPAGCLLMPSLLDAKANVPAKAHGLARLKKLGVLPTHSTFDVMRTLYQQDPKRYALARPDHY